MDEATAGNRRYGAALAAVWLAVQASLLLFSGVHTGLEAEKYTSAADFLLRTGALPAPKYFFYATQVLLIALFQKTGWGYTGVALFQIALNGVATFFLYRLARRTAQSNGIARLTTLLFILFLPLQHWNVYLYTESLFISLTILFTWGLYLYPPDRFKNFLLHLPALLLLCTTRPAGLFFILPFFVYALLLARKTYRKALAATGLLWLAAVLFLLNFALNSGEDMNALKPIREGHVICFIPDPHPPRLQLVESGNSVYDIFYYIVHNPGHFASLMLRRLFSFFNLTRPYYSRIHNVYLLCVILPVYSFIVVALFHYNRLLQPPIFKFMLLLTAFYAGIITFQCDDYHSRFIMPLFPFFFLLAAIGACFSAGYFKRKYSSS